MNLADIFEEAQQRFPTASLNESRMLRYANDAHLELCNACRVYVQENTLTMTTATTYQVNSALTPPAVAARIWEARYCPNADPNQQQPMMPVSIRELDQYRKGWRANVVTGGAANTASEYYVDRDATGNLLLCLLTIPNAGDTILFTASLYVPLTSQSTFPVCVGTGRYYLYYIWERYSEIKEPALMEAFQNKRLDELAKIQKRLSTMDAEIGPRIVPGIGGYGGRA